MRGKVTVNDKIQRKYIYALSEPVGKNFDPSFLMRKYAQERFLRICVDN